jgi:hypothetical protein
MGDYPIGIDDVKSEHPAAIAVSLVADLLVLTEDLAARTEQEDTAPGSVEPAPLSRGRPASERVNERATIKCRRA